MIAMARRQPIAVGFAAFAALAAAAFAVASCGPSFRRTEQSDNAFTRCFDFDYRPGVAADEKTTCWRRWLDDHVYNQPEDKIAYAKLRLEELGRGVSIPGPPGPPGAFDERPVPSRPAPVSVAEVGEMLEGDARSSDAGVDGGI